MYPSRNTSWLETLRFLGNALKRVRRRSAPPTPHPHTAAVEHPLQVPYHHVALPVSVLRWQHACRHRAHRKLGALAFADLLRQLPSDEHNALHWAAMSLHMRGADDELNHLAEQAQRYLSTQDNNLVIKAYADFTGGLWAVQTGRDSCPGMAARAQSPDWMADDWLLLDMLASTDEADRLKQLNTLLARKGLQSVRLRPAEGDDGTAPPLDRLQATELAPLSTDAVPADALVTVIMPLHNAAPTLNTALASLTEQTWPLLEIIAIDDASTDATPTILQQWAARDTRIRVVRHGTNLGAYAARNRGLAMAQGQFVTVADGDDWHHPQKIERQCRHLLSHPHLMANMPASFRATDTLAPVARQVPFFKHANVTSLMFRREPVLAALGGWNVVRFGADTEFYNRFGRIFGHEAIFTMDCPLIIARMREGSLTNNAHFGYFGHDVGARKEYTECYLHFLQHATPDQLRYPLKPDSPSLFQVPTLARSQTQSGQATTLDSIYAGDLRDPEQAARAERQHAQAAQHGLSLGMLHLPLFRLDLDNAIAPSLRDYLARHRMSLLTIGEAVHADLLIHHPAIDVEDITVHYPNLYFSAAQADRSNLSYP